MFWDTPIDHSCEAREADSSFLPNVSPEVPYDQFFIKIDAQITKCSLAEESEEDDDEDYRILDEITCTAPETKEFWVPCDQLLCDMSSWSTISNMLSSVNVPIDVQPYMIHRISMCALSMSSASHNVGKKVLPMIVSIDVLDCVEYNEEDRNYVVAVPAVQSVVATLENVEVENMGSSNTMQCAICLEEILDGSDAKRMPCLHVYHGDCIVKWLGVSNFCPPCRFQMPT